MLPDSFRAIAFGTVAGRQSPSHSAVSRPSGRPSTIACAACGKFISNADIDAGDATEEFEPLNEFGPERSEWFCRRCK